MKREQAMNVLNHIDPALIEAADLPAKSRKPRWFRMAIAAACVCMALLGVVYAMETAGIRVTFFEKDDQTPDGYQVELEPSYIPLEQLSQAAQDYVAAYQDRYIPTRYFSSWSDAVEFLGLDLPGNPVLEGCYKRYAQHFEFNGNDEGQHCTASFSSLSGEGLVSIRLSANYLWSGPDEAGVIRGVGLDLEGRVYIKESEYYDGTEVRRGYHNLDDNGLEEVYTTPSGLEAVIVRLHQSFSFSDHELETYDYVAYFVLDGIAFELTASRGGIAQPQGDIPPTPELALTALKEVLDAFS